MKAEAKEALTRLKDKILDSDNLACFIEREELLRAHAEEVLAQPPEERYRFEFELLILCSKAPNGKLFLPFGAFYCGNSE